MKIKFLIPKNFDKGLFFLVFGMSLLGVLLIFNASSVSAVENFGNKFYFASRQLTWVGISLVFLLCTFMIDYHFFRRLAPLILFIVLICLILVLIPGIGVKVMGGRRWLELGSFPFQPAELAKIAVIIYLAALLEKNLHFSHFLFLNGLLIFLLILEPDLGTTIILTGTNFIIYFLAGGRWKEIFLTFLLGGFAFFLLIMVSPYRRERLNVFLKPNLDSQDSSYHLRQVLLALGSGGLFGRGLGQSRQKFLFLPEAATDSIFAVIGEETGFVCSLFFTGLYLVFLVRGFKIASFAPDKFGQLLAGGITSMIFLQSIINLGAMVSLFPLTGVPLPFISYGGSFLLVSFFGIGILLNISSQSCRERIRKR